MSGSRPGDDDGPPPRLYTVREAARLLAVSEMTLYRQINAGRFPAIRIGARRLIPARCLDEMITRAVETQSVVDPSNWV
jgi:excisionase family DNA binding protein